MSQTVSALCTYVWPQEDTKSYSVVEWESVTVTDQFMLPFLPGSSGWYSKSTFWYTSSCSL